jgi:hypothetical protein
MRPSIPPTYRFHQPRKPPRLPPIHGLGFTLALALALLGNEIPGVELGRFSAPGVRFRSV